MSKELKVEIKKLLRSLGLLVLFLIVVFGVNLLIDPANILNRKYAGEAAKIMANGGNVTNLQNMDDRQLIREYAELRTQPVDVLVLGSSRSMQVTKELTGVDNTFCAGVTGADLRDTISAYVLFREKGLLPKTVILCAEYWFLSQGNLESRAMTEGYETFCAERGHIPFRITSRTKAAIKELFSFAYFQSSIDYLLDQRAALKLESVSDADNIYATRRADGSYSYEESYRNRPVEDVDGDAYNAVMFGNTTAYYFDGVHAEMCRQLEDFIAMMQEDGVEVVVQLAPYHPLYYAHMETSPTYTEILATEGYFYTLELTHGVQCYGGYNPADFGMTNVDFYDAQHPSAEGIYSYFGVKRQQNA